MNSFNDYLNEKKENNEYTSFLNESPIDFFKSIGRAKVVKEVVVKVKFDTPELADRIAKKAEEESTAGRSTDLKTAIKQTAEDVAEAMFNIATGKPTNDEKKKEYNLYNDFKYITVNKTGVEAHFKYSANKNDPTRDYLAAAHDFEKILRNKVNKLTPPIPKNAIIIEESEETKAHARFMNQKKKKWSEVSDMLAAGIEDLQNNLSDKKTIDTLQAKADKIHKKALRDNEIGENETVYYIRWTINSDVINDIMSSRISYKNAINLDQKNLINSFCTYVNQILLDGDLIKISSGYGDDAKFECTTENGYCGLNTTESTIRFYFRDLQAAQGAAQDILSNLGSKYVSSPIEAVRASNDVKKYQPALTESFLGGRQLFTKLILPEICKDRNIAILTITFDSEHAELFKKFLNDDDSINDDETKKYLNSIYSAVSDIDNYIGIGADNESLQILFSSKSGAQIGKRKLNAIDGIKVTSSNLVADLEYIKSFIRFSVNTSFITNEDEFKKFRDKLTELVKSNICATSIHRVIQLNINESVVNKFVTDLGDVNVETLKNKIDEFINDIINKIVNSEAANHYFEGPYINGANVYLVFQNNDNFDIDEIYTKLFVNQNLECTLAPVLMNKKIASYLSKYKEDYSNYIKENTKMFTESCVNIAQNVAKQNGTYDVITVEFTDSYLKNIAKQDNPLTAITTAIKDSLTNEEYKDEILGFYILNKKLTFILDKNKNTRHEHIVKLFKEHFDGALILDEKETLANNTYTTYEQFKNDFIANTDNNKALSHIVKDIISQGNMIKNAKEIANRTKTVISAEIEGIKDDLTADESIYATFKKQLQNVLNEIFKDGSDSKNNNYIGCYCFSVKNKGRIAFVFNPDISDNAEKDAIIVYKGFIEAQGFKNIEAKSMIIPEFELNYIKNDQHRTPDSITDEHIKSLLNGMKTYKDKLDKEKKLNDEKVYAVTVEIDSDAWGKLIVDTDTLSDDEIKNKVFNTIKTSILNCIEQAGDTFIGITSENHSIIFLFKQNISTEIMSEILRNMPHAKYVGTSKSYKCTETSISTDIQAKFKEIINKVNSDEFTVDNFPKLINAVSSAATKLYSDKANKKAWQIEIDFGGIDNKHVSELIKVPSLSSNIYITRLIETATESFSNSLKTYLMSLVNEAARTTNKNYISDIPLSFPDEINDEIDYILNDNSENIEEYRHAIKELLQNYKITEQSDLYKQFLNAWAKQFISEGETLNVKVEPKISDKIMILTVTGEASNCEEYAKHIQKIAANSYDLIVDNKVNIKKPQELTRNNP